MGRLHSVIIWPRTIEMIVTESKDKTVLAQMGEVFPRDKYDKVSFDGKGLSSEKAYVAWLDIMGAGAAMRRSLDAASVMVGKFHASIINAYREAVAKDKSFTEVQIHSLTDGAYIVAHSPERMQSALRYIMKHLVQVFLESSFENKFMIRSAVAYGKIVSAATMSGKLIGEKQNQAIGAEHVRNVTLGAPFEKAYKGETYAPPFGVYLDETAEREGEFGEGRVWKWWDEKKAIQVEWCKELNIVLQRYLAEILNHYYVYGVQAEKISNYSARCTSYFAQ